MGERITITTIKLVEDVTDHFIQSYLNALILSGIEIVNKIEVEKKILQDIIDSKEDFGHFSLKYKNCTWTMDVENHFEEILQIDIEDYLLY